MGPQVLEAEPFLPCNTFQTLANIWNCWTAFPPASEEHCNLDRECPFALSHVIQEDLDKGGDLLETVLATFLTVQGVMEQHTE